jgi:hypothetical protein
VELCDEPSWPPDISYGIQRFFLGIVPPSAAAATVLICFSVAELGFFNSFEATFATFTVVSFPGGFLRVAIQHFLSGAATWRA